MLAFSVPPKMRRQIRKMPPQVGIDFNHFLNLLTELLATTSFGLFGASKDLEKKDTASLGLGQPSTTKEGDKKDAPCL